MCVRLCVCICVRVCFVRLCAVLCVQKRRLRFSKVECYLLASQCLVVLVVITMVMDTSLAYSIFWESSAKVDSHSCGAGGAKFLDYGNERTRTVRLRDTGPSFFLFILKESPWRMKKLTSHSSTAIKRLALSSVLNHHHVSSKCKGNNDDVNSAYPIATIVFWLHWQAPCLEFLLIGLGQEALVW